MKERNTIQCALTLEAVNKLKNHASADEVFREVAANHPNIGRGTVYRNLNKLAESGKVRKIEIPDGSDRFDHRLDPHYHVRCVKCGKVSDVDMDYLQHLEESVRNARGYELTGYTLVFGGICPECAKNASDETAADC